MRRTHPESGDLDHIDCWVFDLDNTLYCSRKYDLFPAMGAKMELYLQRTLGISREQAQQLRAQWSTDHGTTLRGLMIEHGLAPDTFLEFVHDLDLDQIQPEPALDRAIAALPGRKVVFTNATVKYAVDIMDRLGVSAHFDHIFDVAAADYVPKPQMPAYDQFLKATGVRPERSIFFEDMARNLAPAAQIGMTTVWVENERANAGPTPACDHIHYIAEDLTRWLQAAAASR
ncbi:MAG: pyrimidine 5'-nucleotidase [Alphaproteobacteria bacterium]|nr:pyrimidine 5'-nucleotidase [Alphaproteobacteria bacterium]MCB9929287.1 pyrimidine 5'-nucleotidase [Alphaproteobacteria bacterium]